MNKPLGKLYKLLSKPTLKVIGCMSGTSVDGLDIALCTLSGSGQDTEIRCDRFITLDLPEIFREKILSLQSREQINCRALTVLNAELGNLMGDLILQALNIWGITAEEVDLIGSHGQTIYHAPAVTGQAVNATLQIADGDHISFRTGIPVISDFRQKHTAAGGEGAPLAALFDQMLFQDKKNHRMLLNLGGISNLTWLPSESSGWEVISGDVGPANTLINEAMIKYFDRPYDEDGIIASEGNAHSGLIKYILLEPYFRRPFPKTTGQEEFRLFFIEDLMQGHGIELDPKDLIASLTEVTIQSISRAAEEVTQEHNFELFVSGGGVHNKTIMTGLEERIPNARVYNFSELGIDPDAKEAVMMAFFANELIRGDGVMVEGEKVHLGKVSLSN
ncbi:anhydro-N-acetylmuramic acid kinase [Balneola sp. MJW-20]|uniref:anhydro-N-acetylmuramic acid kinase n=1 Tax=Gracilimonas aurantiaca TaxID=3234185 RepID=UPI0038B3F6F5